MSKVQHVTEWKTDWNQFRLVFFSLSIFWQTLQLATENFQNQCNCNWWSSLLKLGSIQLWSFFWSSELDLWTLLPLTFWIVSLLTACIGIELLWHTFYRLTFSASCILRWSPLLLNMLSFQSRNFLLKPELLHAISDLGLKHPDQSFPIQNMWNEGERGYLRLFMIWTFNPAIPDDWWGSNKFKPSHRNLASSGFNVFELAWTSCLNMIKLIQISVQMVWQCHIVSHLPFYKDNSRALVEAWR